MHRKSKARKASRKASRKMRGGAHLSPADINDSTMMGPSNQMLAQGKDYQAIHAGQHGGSYQYSNQAPVGDQGLLDASLRAAARITPLDAATAAASGMSDQSGGSRKGRIFNWKSLSKRFGMGKKSKSKKSMFNGLRKMFKSRKGKGKGKSKSKKSMFNGLRKMFKGKSRKQRGGANLTNQADYSAPGMLLSPSMEAKALGGMNPEWKLAADPTSFAPK